MPAYCVTEHYMTSQPQPRLKRGLIAQIVSLLAAGAAVGIVVNELGAARRVSYFGFQKREVLNARLARAVREAEAQSVSPTAAGPLEVVFFFTECEGCVIVREKVLPEIKRLFGQAVAIREHDCADAESYNLLLDHEKRFGSDEDEMLKLFIGERRYLSGVKQIVDQSIAAISQALADQRGTTDGR